MASTLVLQRRLFRLLQLLPPSSSSSIHAVPFLSGIVLAYHHHLQKVSAPSLLGVCAVDGQLCHLLSQFHVQKEVVASSSLLDEGEFHRLADSTIHSVQEKLEDYGDLVEVDGFDIDYGNDVLTVKLGDLGTYVLNKQTPNRQLWLSSPLSKTSPCSLWFNPKRTLGQFLLPCILYSASTQLLQSVTVTPIISLTSFVASPKVRKSAPATLNPSCHQVLSITASTTELTGSSKSSTCSTLRPCSLITATFLTTSCSSGPSRFDWDGDAEAWIYRRKKANLYKLLEGELEQLCGKTLVLS
ncbi:hypothetical protein ACSQ67_000916 [Phaseolus vulgaris]